MAGMKARSQRVSAWLALLNLLTPRASATDTGQFCSLLSQKALPTEVLLGPRNGASKHWAGYKSHLYFGQQPRRGIKHSPEVTPAGSPGGGCMMLKDSKHPIYSRNITGGVSRSISRFNLVDTCGQTIQGDRITVRSHQESRKHYFVTMGTDCHLTMQAVSPRDNVQFHFHFFLVYSLLHVSLSIQQHLTSSTPLSEASRSLLLPVPTKPGVWSEPTTMEGSGDPCYAGSYIQFYDGKNNASPPIGSPLCGKSLPKAVMSTGDYLTLRLVTRGSQPRVDFVGVFTSLRLGQQSDGTSVPAIPSLVPLANRSCGTPVIMKPDSVTDSSTNVLVLILYITLGLLAGVVVLCWCCWSPGWFLWRVSICHFLSCCSSTCASCKLCTFSCSCTEFCLSKVTPQGTTNTTVAM